LIYLYPDEYETLPRNEKRSLLTRLHRFYVVCGETFVCVVAFFVELVIRPGGRRLRGHRYFFPRGMAHALFF